MQITATTEEKVKVVYECLTTGLPYFVDYGFTLDYNGHEYNKAKKSLDAQKAAGTFDNGLSSICVEDVQAEMLRMGFTLKFKGGEGNKASHVTPLNLEVIERNWDKVKPEQLLEVMQDNYDALSADIVMQGLLFGDIVYG